MGHSEVGRLIKLFEEGKLSRRDLSKRTAALGLTAGALSLGVSMGSSELLARRVAAQDANADGIMTANNEQTATYLRNFNPLGSTAGTARWFTGHGMYESLMIWDVQTAKLVPWLAESYEFSDDNLTLTAKLRQGVKWSDGEDFTSADVKFTWDTMVKVTELGGNGARTVLDEKNPIVTKIDAPDDYTVVWHFARPYTIGVYDIMGQLTVPEHIWSKISDPVKELNENPVGTGPFTEVKRFEAQIYELGKNPYYWQPGKPYFEGVRFPAYTGNDQVNLATMNGELDWTANFIPDIEKTFVSKDPEHNHYWFPQTGACVMLYCNTEVKPLDDPNVRKAISMAINREQICTVAMFDYTHPADATGLSDAFDGQKDETAKGATWTQYNVDEANKLLDAAGLNKDGDYRKGPDGAELTYDINVVSGWSDWVQSVDIIAESLKEIGIKAQVKPYDYTTWIDKVQKGDFTMSIGWSSQGQTVFNFYRGCMSSQTYHKKGTVSGENWHRYQNKDVDQLLQDFATTSDEAKQKEISAKLQQAFADQAPCIPLFPGPQWGEYTTYRFDGFPNKDNPYTTLSTYAGDISILINAVYPVGSEGEHTVDVIPPAGGASPAASPEATPKA